MPRVVVPPAGGNAPDESAAARVGWGFIALYAAAFIGTWLALLTPIIVTLSLRIGQLVPQNPVGPLSLVLGLGALCALLSNPVFGRLSDRTTSRWGMRRPWLIGGALVGLVALAGVALAPSVPWLVFGWCVAQLAFNAVIAPLAALLPDQVPAEQRGTVAGIISICIPIGQMCGAFLVQLVSGSTFLMFMVPAVIGVTAILLLALRLNDRLLVPTEPIEPLRLADFRQSFWVGPQHSPDFGRIFCGRFFLVVGTAFIMAYQPLYLMRSLGVESHRLPDAIFRATSVYAVMVILSGLVTGRLSDVAGRRKPFVIVAALLYAAAAVSMGTAMTYGMFLAGLAAAGIAYGAYTSVDFAMIADVLPADHKDAAKDLGVFNIASTLPQIIAPLSAPWILNLSDGRYGAIYAAVAMSGLLASLVVSRVKRVR